MFIASVGDYRGFEKLEQDQQKREGFNVLDDLFFKTVEELSQIKKDDSSVALVQRKGFKKEVVKLGRKSSTRELVQKDLDEGMSLEEISKNYSIKLGTIRKAISQGRLYSPIEVVKRRAVSSKTRDKIEKVKLDVLPAPFLEKTGLEGQIKGGSGSKRKSEDEGELSSNRSSNPNVKRVRLLSGSDLQKEVQHYIDQGMSEDAIFIQTGVNKRSINRAILDGRLTEFRKNSGTSELCPLWEGAEFDFDPLGEEIEFDVEDDSWLDVLCENLDSEK